MKPRVSDFVGALVLTLVLFSLVAIIFISAVGDADRIHREEAREASRVTRQVQGQVTAERATLRAG